MKKLLLVATVVIGLVLVPTAEAKPTLLLMHPGAFVFGSPASERSAALYARSRGWNVRNLDYPLGDIAGAMRYTAAAVKAAPGPVYAYGDSAGASLAIRLAERGLVRRAAGYSPVVYARPWWLHVTGLARQDVGPDFWRDLWRVSPGLHDSPRPALVVGGRDDPLTKDARAWAPSDADVHLRVVPGGHLGRLGSPLYLENMRAAINWLREPPL